MPRIPPVAVQIEVPREPAWHIADASTLYRRPVTYDIPPGCTRITVPAAAESASAFGALAQAGLLLPIPMTSVRYALPVELTSGIVEVWRRCPMTGLELPSTAAEEAWRRAASAVKLMATPSELGVRESLSALRTVAWGVLCRAFGSGDEVLKQLIGLGFRLDIVGVKGELHVELAKLIATRWKIGAGLVAAATADRLWLNPRCLRWIVRELAAARTATALGLPPQIVMTAEEIVAAREFFPHVYFADAEPDFIDVVMAAWILHEDFHGARLVDDNTVGDLIGMITALGFANGSWTASLERFASLTWIWSVDDTDPIGVRIGWNGTPPSVLRTAFVGEVGIDVLDWLAGCLAVLIPSWTNAGQLTAPIFFRRLEDRIPPSPLTPAIAKSIERELTLTVRELGKAVLVQVGGLARYQGIGTTPQEERSPLYERPVLEFDDGTGVVVSAVAFADRAVALPRTIIERSGLAGNRKKVGGGVGRLFEVGVARLVSRLRSRYTVLLGDEIDRLVMPRAKRGDIAVSSVDSTAFLECGLQPWMVGASLGDSTAVDDMLMEYGRKLQQALDTPKFGAVWAGVPRIRSHATGYFVVVDDPVAFNAVHCARVRELCPGAPELFVVGIDDLTRLVDLAEQGIDFPGALIAWQTGGSRLPVDHHIAQLERLVRPSWNHMFGLLWDLAGRLIPEAAA